MAVIETNENETIELLQTHYYKASYDEVKKAYLEILENLGHNVESINDDYCEIFSTVPHMSVTAKISSITPKETAIDFYVNAEYLLFSSKKGLEFIQTVYKGIAKSYEFKGLGLHK